MQPKRSMASNPFAQVFLNMLNLWDREEIALPDLSIRYLGGLDLHMPVDVLTLFAAVSGGNLELMYVYSTELFKPTTIERMASDLKTIVECAVAAPNTRILDFSLSTSATDNKEGSLRPSMTTSLWSNCWHISRRLVCGLLLKTVD